MTCLKASGFDRNFSDFQSEVFVIEKNPLMRPYWSDNEEDHADVCRRLNDQITAVMEAAVTFAIEHASTCTDYTGEGNINGKDDFRDVMRDALSEFLHPYSKAADAEHRLSARDYGLTSITAK